MSSIVHQAIKVLKLEFLNSDRMDLDILELKLLPMHLNHSSIRSNPASPDWIMEMSFQMHTLSHTLDLNKKT